MCGMKFHYFYIQMLYCMLYKFWYRNATSKSIDACQMSPLEVMPEVSILIGETVNITCNITSTWHTLRIDLNKIEIVAFYSQKDKCTNDVESSQNFTQICHLRENNFGIGFRDIRSVKNNTNVTFSLTYGDGTKEVNRTTRIVIEPIKVTLTATKITAEENENMDFQCVARGVATTALAVFKWYKHPYPFTTYGYDYTESRSKVTSNFQYKAALHDNGAVISCDINVLGNKVQSNNQTIIVGRGPTNVCIYPYLQTYVPRDDDTTQIFCRSNCTPSCSYKWLSSANAAVIGEDSRFPYPEIGIDDRIATYHCLATNPRTGKTKTTMLKIYTNKIGADVIMTKSGLYNILEHSSFFLPCLQPDTTLLHNRNKIEIENVITQGNAIISNNEENETVISNVTCFDAGLYTCKSTDCYGDGTLLRFNVSVLCQPYFLSGEKVKYIEISIGDPIDISVSFVGYPPPSTSLERTQNSTIKIQNGSFGFLIYESRQGIIHSISINKRHAEMGDSGIYSVKISNYIGKTTAHISVKVMTISFLSKIATLVGITAACVMISIALIAIAKQLRRRVCINDNQVRSDSVHYVNGEAMLPEADGSMGHSFDDEYLYQNRIREIELRAAESYENLSITADNTSYEKVGSKPGLNEETSQERESELDSHELEINCHIRRGSDGYLIATGLQPLEILSESERRESEETSEERSSNEDAEGYIIMNVPRSVGVKQELGVNFIEQREIYDKEANNKNNRYGCNTDDIDEGLP